MKHLHIIVAMLLAMSPAILVAEEDAVFNHGKKTHQNHCLKCHTDAMYTRENRVVKSISALGTQVRRCRDGLGKIWFDDDTDAVVHFLDKQYYKF